MISLSDSIYQENRRLASILGEKRREIRVYEGADDESPPLKRRCGSYRLLHGGYEGQSFATGERKLPLDEVQRERGRERENRIQPEKKTRAIGRSKKRTEAGSQTRNRSLRFVLEAAPAGITTLLSKV
ncbi:hypothetical protein B296_00052521 [Ensete ventricosum]|uniref:Uncharacterized protein n=1 Tax=Ensete ventricosum TaxID=4639 RepID=A0A426X359_ENSVE|nr:hypothetical protein B296_00052521 [Ensete ventricosum]